MGLVSRSDRGGHDVAWRRAVAGGVAIGLASALLAALGAADAPRWPLAGLPPAWWPGVTDLERLHAYGGLALGGLGAATLQGRSGGLCRTVATLRDGLRPAIGRLAARLGAWAERH